MNPVTEFRHRIKEKLEAYINTELDDETVAGLFLPEDHPDFFYAYRIHILDFQGMTVSLKIENQKYDNSI